MTNSQDDGRTEPSYDLDQLYAGYCEFMLDARRAVLALDPCEKERQSFFSSHRVMSKGAFASCIKRLKEDPNRLARFIELTERGWQPAKNSAGRSRPLPDDSPRSR